VTESRIWLDVAAIAFAVMLVLALALRSVLLPAVVSLLGALVTGAAFGVLALLFGGPHPPMGGPGYLDPITIISVFTLAFGITAMFSIVPLRRARTAFATGAGTGEVLKVLREATATRAGLLMIGALIPFVLTGLLNVRALGIGLAVAVLLNALIVGPALLPAALALLRRYGWWPTFATGLGSPGQPHRGKPLLPQLPERRARPARP
jgi:RND superfamily putative drug exporter